MVFISNPILSLNLAAQKFPPQKEIETSIGTQPTLPRSTFYKIWFFLDLFFPMHAWSVSLLQAMGRQFSEEPAPDVLYVCQLSALCKGHRVGWESWFDARAEAPLESFHFILFEKCSLLPHA